MVFALSADCDGLPLLAVLSLCVVAVVVAWHVLAFSNPRTTPCHFSLSLVLAACSFLGLLAIFPEDVASAVANAHGNLSKHDLDQFRPLLKTLVQVLFWGGFFVSKLVLPFQEMLVASGAFGCSGVVREAMTTLFARMAVMVVAGGVFVVVICSAGWVPWDLEAVEVSAIGLSNSAGLIDLTLLLGFGLVELPRAVWHKGNLRRRLRCLQGAVAVESRCASNAKLFLSSALADALRFKRIAHHSLVSTPTARANAARAARMWWWRRPRRRAGEWLEHEIDHAKQLVGAVVDDTADSLGASTRDHSKAQRSAASNPTDFASPDGGVMTKAAAADLVKAVSDSPAGFERRLSVFRAQVAAAQRSVLVSQARVEEIESQAWYCEDLLAARQAVAEHGDNWGVQWLHGHGAMSGPADYLYHVHLRPWGLKVLAVLLSLVSMGILLCQLDVLVAATMGTSTKQSGASTLRTNSWAPIAMALVLLAVLAYVASVLAWSISSQRRARELALIPGQRTSPLALSHYVRHGCSVTAPLLFFLLNVLGLSGRDSPPHVQFDQVYGRQVLVSFLAKNFAIFFPTVIIALSLLQLCDAYNALLRKLGLPDLQFATAWMEESDAVRERGQLLLAQRRRHTENVLRRQSFDEKHNAPATRPFVMDKHNLLGSSGLADTASSPVRVGSAGLFGGLRDLFRASTDSGTDVSQQHYSLTEDADGLAFLDPLLESVQAASTPSAQAGLAEVRRQQQQQQQHQQQQLLKSQPEQVSPQPSLRLQTSATSYEPSEVYDAPEFDHYAESEEEEEEIGTEDGTLDLDTLDLLESGAPYGASKVAALGSDGQPAAPMPHHAGWLHKLSPSPLAGWQRRFFEVNPRTGRLEYFKDGPALGRQRKLQGAIDLRYVVHIKQVYESPSKFELVASTRTYELRAANAHEATAWVAALRASMQQLPPLAGR